VHDFEQNDPARDAGWLLHRVKGTLQRRDRLVFEPCNKANTVLKWYQLPVIWLGVPVLLLIVWSLIFSGR
jgi:hypothetical protein